MGPSCGFQNRWTSLTVAHRIEILVIWLFNFAFLWASGKVNCTISLISCTISLINCTISLREPEEPLLPRPDNINRPLQQIITCLYIYFIIRDFTIFSIDFTVLFLLKDGVWISGFVLLLLLIFFIYIKRFRDSPSCSVFSVWLKRFFDLDRITLHSPERIVPRNIYINV